MPSTHPERAAPGPAAGPPADGVQGPAQAPCGQPPPATGAAPGGAAPPPGEATHRPDVLLVVTGDRYGTGQFGTVRRLVDAALRSGYSLQIWACGYANMLTQRRPPAAGCAPAGAAGGPDGTEAGSAAEFIRGMVTEHTDSFSWVACRTCSEDHGGGEHIDGVLTEPSFADFHAHVQRATKVIYIGGG